KSGALRERERLAEEGRGRRDARQLVAGYAESEQHVGPVDVAELRPLGDPPRLVQLVDRLGQLTDRDSRPRLSHQRPELEVGDASADDGAHAPEGPDRLV